MIKLKNILSEIDLDPGFGTSMIIYIEGARRGDMEYCSVHKIVKQPVYETAMDHFKVLVNAQEEFREEMFRDTGEEYDIEEDIIEEIINMSSLCYKRNEDIAQVTVEEELDTYLVISSNHSDYEILKRMESSEDDPKMKEIVSNIIEKLVYFDKCIGPPRSFFKYYN